MPALVASEGNRSIVAEAFRNLRTNLQYAALGSKLRLVVVTAAGPEEGKSTVTANLGVAMAQAGTRVLVVGADLRRPSLHRAFGVGHHIGLVSVLLERMSLEEAVQHHEPTGVDVLASGPLPPNPAELLGSKRMTELLQQMAERWDTVLIDTPPAVALSDAALLAARSDGVLLVVTAGQTPRDVVVAARRQLEQVGAHILGAVINRVRPTDSGQYYHYYYYYYSDGSPSSGRERPSAKGEMAGSASPTGRGHERTQRRP